MKVAVLGGGRSSEHEISLASAEAVRAGLAAAGHEVLDVRIDRAGVWRHDGRELAPAPGRGLLGADVVFPALHGPFGEDGTIQGLLECLDVPYVGASVLASAVCMDKLTFKDLVGAAGMPQVAYGAVHLAPWQADRDAVLAALEPLGLPVFVKPSRLGSSVGIAKVVAAAELPAAIEAALAHDPRVIVEAMSSGVEVECSVIGNGDPLVSELGEIVIDADWYDFEAKYTPGAMRLQIPARISPAARDRLCELARRAFLHAGVSGLARADFFVEGDDVLLNELNTMPGNTPTSVFGRLFEASGIPYPELMDRLIGYALERHAAERAHTF